MKGESNKDIGKIFTERVLVDAAMRRAMREAIRQHRLAGVPMVVWRDGKVVHLPAEQLERELEELERAGRPSSRQPHQA